ncbi:RGS domain-containing protein [Ceratocystis lukuohia]|uniref:RGS domain-containing protein n=1 Tax=Ceratocystis lukuohia TaxID=2019550 RepID=A0ABR4MTY8_9PEZI
MLRPVHRQHTPNSPSPYFSVSSRESASSDVALFEDSASSVSSCSRPSSARFSSAMSLPRPDLQDVLKNRAPPPFTLGAFMAYLSQNHCLETLEFSLDAEQYRLAYTRTLERSAGQFSPRDVDHLTKLWEKLLHVYLMPYATREINIPAYVKEPVINIDYFAAIPHPDVLADIVRVVHELMTDSVLGPWVESILSSPVALEGSRRRSGLSSPPQSQYKYMHGRSNSSSLEKETLRESPMGEPVTPPTTPSIFEWTLAGSPPSKSCNSGGGGSWRKMGAKLGLAKKKKSVASSEMPLPGYY